MAVVHFCRHVPTSADGGSGNSGPVTSSSASASAASSSSSAAAATCTTVVTGVEDVIESLERRIAESSSGKNGGSYGRGGSYASSSISGSAAVKELCCSEVLTDDQDLESLDAFLRRNTTQMNLRCLRLPKNGLTASSCPALVHILHITTDTLVELDLSDNRLLGEGLAPLVDALTGPHCRLRKLNLNNNKIGPKGASALASLLRNNSSVRDLSIANNALGARTVKSIVVDLCENETLERLDISYNKISDRGANLLAAALDPETSKSKLQDLVLSYNKIGPAGVFNITKALLEGNKTLKRLNLSLNRIGPEGADCFGVVLKFSHTLEELVLSRNNLEEGVANLLHGLQDSQETNLQILDLSWNSLTDDAAVMLAKVLRGNSVLRSLNLASNAIGSRGTIALAEALTYNLALQELDLVGNQADDQSAAVLADVLCRPGCKLETLRWEKNNFSPVGTKRVEAAFTFRKNMKVWLGRYLHDIERRRVLSLNLLSKNMGDDEVVALSAHLKKHKPRVTTLWIDGERLTGRGIVSLSRDVLASNTVNLERLYLQDTLLGDYGAAALAQALLSNTKLRVMSLISCNITADGAQKLANAIRRNKSLVRVNLRGNRIGDLGAREVLNTVLVEPPHPTLKALNVSCCGITDQGLSLSSSPLELDELHLGHNEITDLGALELAKSICVSGQRSLRWLGLSGNRLTSKGIQTLKLFLPPSSVLEADDQQAA